MVVLFHETFWWLLDQFGIEISSSNIKSQSIPNIFHEYMEAL